ncbi:MAG: hypothetical protein NTX50_13145 [Candidatus Sumerlaeota bacterium]|nr:hypothetical protein [Candidatus Sumerlaeota bacterium]
MKMIKTIALTAALLLANGIRVGAAEDSILPGAWSAAVPIASGAAQHFVSPDGKPTATGAKEDPWDIVSALEGKHPIKPGDVIWIRGGVYKNPDRKHDTMGWIVSLSGTEKAPIHIRAYPGERATIDSGLQLGFKGKAEYVWLWDLEMIVSDLQRETKTPGSAPADLSGPLGGLHVANSKGCKYINLMIHQTCQGISFWVGALDSEVHGCLIYDNGWKSTDRNHGHCIYTQNKDGLKTISGCILSTPWGGGQQLIQAYGSKAAFVNGFHIEDNIGYSLTPQGDRLLIGGGAPGNKDNQALRNYLYNANLQIGYTGKPHEDCKAIGNIVANGSISVSSYKHCEIRDNVVVGGGISPANCEKVINEGNKIYAKDKRPEAPQAILIPNKYDPTRAHLAIFNWTKASEVKASTAPFLKSGENYRLLDPKDFYGKPVFEGKCDGETIAVPMKTEFVAFVILKR